MKTMLKTLTLLALTVSLTACDRALTDERRTERDEACYQQAMREYRAGNLKKAVAQLEDALRKNPGNQSARFLLATLQYERRDNLGAFCNFREFIQQAPDGDKKEMARQRMALCEEGLAKELAKKMRLTENAAIVRESEDARKALQASETSLSRLDSDLKSMQHKVAALEEENARLRRMVGIVGQDEPERKKQRPEDVRSLLDDDETETVATALGTTALGAAAEAPETERKGGLIAAKEILSADAGDAQGPVSLPDASAQTPGTKPTAKLSEMTGGPDLGRFTNRQAKDPESSHEKHPDSYVVQEGDTLYKIAVRFYGSQGAWRRIREANKATISNDGRVKAGQRIVLP